MEANVLRCSPRCPKSSSTVFHNNSFSVRTSLQPTPCNYRHIIRIRAASSNDSSNNGDTPQPPQPTITPPDTVEIRFRRGSRKRSKQQKTDGRGDDGLPVPSPPKNWEDMTLQEKGIELYMGEKGLLFWLNKFAYASIYIVIGAWILFRFVGPALNLYQLDAPTLSPDKIFK